MFAIDLLKGKATPERVNFKKFIFRALLIAIPVASVAGLAAVYQLETVSAQTLQKSMGQKQQELDRYGKNVAEYNTAKLQINQMDRSLSEISKALAYRIQVSDILIELIQELPNTIFIEEIKMDRKSIEKIERSSSSQKRKLAIQRKLDLVLCGLDPATSDRAVQEYLGKLEQSTLLSEVFTEINPSARQQGRIDEQNAIFYEIECVLREQE